MKSNSEIIRSFCLTSEQEFYAWKKRQDKKDLKIEKPDFSSLFGMKELKQ